MVDVNNEILFQNFIKDKNVIIVGPSPRLLDTNLGDIIDSYDVVIRTNGAFPVKYKSDYGARCDILYINERFRRYELYEKLNQYINTDLKFICYKNINVDIDYNLNNIIFRKWKFFNRFSIKDVKNTNLIGLYVINEMIYYGAKSVAIAGMDFFIDKEHIHYDGYISNNNFVFNYNYEDNIYNFDAIQKYIYKLIKEDKIKNITPGFYEQLEDKFKDTDISYDISIAGSPALSHSLANNIKTKAENIVKKQNVIEIEHIYSTFLMMITTYNRIEYLKQTIESWNKTREKNYKWILVVADDGSTDGSLEYLDNLDIDGVDKIIIKNNHIGVVGQKNSLVRVAKFLDFNYGFMADDDLIFKKEGWDTLYANASYRTGYYHLVFCDHNFYKYKNKEYKVKDNILECKLGDYDPQGALWTFTKEVLYKTGYFNDDIRTLKYHCEYTYRCAAAGYNDINNIYDIKDSDIYIELIKENYKSSLTNNVNNINDNTYSLKQPSHIYIHNKSDAISFVILTNDKVSKDIKNNINLYFNDSEIIYISYNDFKTDKELYKLIKQKAHGDIIVIQDSHIRYNKTVRFNGYMEYYGVPFVPSNNILLYNKVINDINQYLKKFTLNNRYINYNYVCKAYYKEWITILADTNNNIIYNDLIKKKYIGDYALLTDDYNYIKSLKSEKLKVYNVYNETFGCIKTYVEDIYDNDSDYDDYLIILGYNDSKFSIDDVRKQYPHKKIVIYQLEQLYGGCSNWWNDNANTKFVKDNTVHVKHQLRWCDEIWDYDVNNIDFLKEHNINKYIKFKPLLYSSKLNYQINDDIKYDIIFYGSLNEKRNKILLKLDKKYKLLILTNDNNYKRYHLLFKNIIDGSEWGSDLFNNYISQAKIVLNLHYYDCNIQEQARIFEAFNNNKIVVSEKSLTNYYGDLIYEFDNDIDMYNIIDNILQNELWSNSNITERFKKQYSLMKIGASYNTYYGLEILEKSIDSLYPIIDYINIIHQTEGANETKEPFINKYIINDLVNKYQCNIKYVKYSDDKNFIINKRNIGLADIKEHNCDYIMPLDTDELYDYKELYNEVRYMAKNDIDTLYCPIKTYYYNDKYWFIDDYYVPAVYKIDDRYFINNKTSVLCDPERKMVENKYKISDIYMNHYSYILPLFTNKYKRKGRQSSNSRIYKNIYDIYEYMRKWNFVDDALVFQNNKDSQILQLELVKVNKKL